MGNLKLKIVLTAVMLVFAIVPAVIVGAIGTFSVMGYERSAKDNTLQQVGESKSAGIKQAFKSYSSIVGAIAKSEAAVDVAHGMGSADAELEAAVAADPDILDMMILDDSGTVIEAVNGSEGGVFENLPMNDQGVINMPSVSEMLNWTSYGDAIFVADPIPSDNASGEAGYVVAIVSAGPDSAVMKALSGQFVNLSGASFMIVDKNGVAVNYKQSGSINKEFAGSALQSDIAQFFDTSNSGYSDLKNSKDIKSIKGSAGGSTYFVGLAGTDVMNWRWVASADNAAFSKFSTTTNLLGWVVVAASAVVFSIASLLVIGRFLGNMNGMLKTMTEISEAEGSTDIRFKVTNRRSELGEIQTSFNELLDEVFLSEERHRTIAELSDNMLFEWDFHKERMYASKNMLAKFDIDTDSATLSNGKFIDSLMSQDDSEKYKRDMNGLLKNKSGYSAEYQLTTRRSSSFSFPSVQATTSCHSFITETHLSGTSRLRSSAAAQSALLFPSLTSTTSSSSTTATVTPSATRSSDSWLTRSAPRSTTGAVSQADSAAMSSCSASQIKMISQISRISPWISSTSCTKATPPLTAQCTSTLRQVSAWRSALSTLKM